MTERLRWVIIWSVLVVWVLNFVAGLLPFLDYEPQEAINGIFTLIVGSAWAGSAWVTARKGGDGDG